MFMGYALTTKEVVELYELTMFWGNFLCWGRVMETHHAWIDGIVIENET